MPWLDIGWLGSVLLYSVMQAHVLRVRGARSVQLAAGPGPWPEAGLGPVAQIGDERLPVR